MHELAPNLAFFISPFIAELFLDWSELACRIGLSSARLSILASISFARFGRGGEFPGESPLSSAFGTLMRTPSFWLMVILFGLGVSSTVGVYAMLPLYLVTERGLRSELGQHDSWPFPVCMVPFLGLLGRLGVGQAGRQDKRSSSAWDLPAS